MFLNVLITIVLPLFLLMGIGYLLDRRFDLDVQTLSRINFYALAPAIVFNLTFNSELSVNEITGIGVFYALHTVILFALAFAVFSLPAFRSQRPALTMGSVFHNVGYYGIPFMLLAFGDDAVGVVGVILVVQQLIFFTVGMLYFVGTSAGSFKETVLRVIRYPVLYALLLGLVMRFLNSSLPTPIESTLGYLTGGYVGLALINLGVQLSKCPFMGDLGKVTLSGIMRFAIAPILALLLIPLFGFNERIGAIIIV